MNHAKQFCVGETHGVLLRQGVAVEATSDELGWQSLFVSVQREQPYSGGYDAVRDHLIVVYRDGPTRINQEISGTQSEKAVPPGGLLILPAGEEFSIRLSDPVSTIHLYVRAGFIREAAMEFAAGDPNCVEIIPRLGQRDQLIENTAYGVSDLVRNRVQGDWFAESIARMIAIQLVVKHSTARLKNPLPDEGLPPERLKAVKDFIEAGLGEPISLADMANVAAFSPTYFARQFKKSTGQSPHQYLLTARIETAKRLLRTRLPIAEIALRCGFSHQEHLTRMFRRFEGMTPAVFRKSA